MAWWKALWIAAALSLFLAACVTPEALLRGIDRSLAEGNHLEAIQTIQGSKELYGEKNTVLYLLDLGLVFHYAGEPDSSIFYLLQAERAIEELYTKSISQQVLSFVLYDNILPYEGEDHEKVLINLFLALNFAKIGMIDDALVEARKADVKLREYSRRYEETNTYKEDAFIRYMTGALYETAGDINDAFIAYRNAFAAYQQYEQHYATPAPSFLLDDLVRTATLIGFDEEAKRFVKLGGRPFDRAKTRSEGSVLVITYVGQGPVKQEVKPVVSIADSAGTLHTFQIALPKFVLRYFGGRDYRIKLAGEVDTVHARAETAENITAIASTALEERLTLTYLKAGGRAVLKFLAAERAKADLKKHESKRANVLGSIAIDLLVGATEQADTRTWRTLPAEIRLARVAVPAGNYTCSVRTADGRVVLNEQAVMVRPGKTTFVIANDVR